VSLFKATANQIGPVLKLMSSKYSSTSIPSIENHRVPSFMFKNTFKIDPNLLQTFVCISVSLCTSVPSTQLKAHPNL